MKKVKEAGVSTYLDELLKEVLWLRESNEYVYLPAVDLPENIAPIEKPDKDESILNMK